MSLRTIELKARGPGLDRTLVLLHGYGADEHDLLPIAHELDPRLRLLLEQVHRLIQMLLDLNLPLMQVRRGVKWRKGGSVGLVDL